MIFLETDRLILRDFEPSDFEDVHEYSSDYENVKHMMFGPNTPEQTLDYLERQCLQERVAEPRMHYNIALQRKEDGKVLGGMSLHLNWRRDDGILGMILNRHCSGKGYSTEGMAGATDYFFGVLKLHRVHAVCDVNNAGIIHVFEKLGFRNEGCMIKRGKNRPEEKEMYFDQYGYAILAEEWTYRYLNTDRRQPAAVHRMAICDRITEEAACITRTASFFDVIFCRVSARGLSAAAFLSP